MQNPVLSLPKDLEDVLHLLSVGYPSLAKMHLDCFVQKQYCMHQSIWDQIEILREWINEVLATK